MINNTDKINIINNRINNFNVHIDILTNDIKDNPDADVEGKLTRQYVLNDFISIKNALISEILVLTNQD